MTNIIRKKFPEYCFKWFTLIFDGEKSSQLDPDYFGYNDDLDTISESWKVNEDETILMYKNCDYPWSDRVLKLFEDEKLIDENTTLPDFYKKFPIGDENEWVKYKDKKPINICFILDVLFERKQIDKSLFILNCKNNREFSNCYDNWERLDGIFVENHGEYYPINAELNSGKLTIILNFMDQGKYRTFGEKPSHMCFDCKFKPESSKKLKICLTCNLYVRSVEILEKILVPYKLLNVNGTITLDNKKIINLKQEKIEKDLTGIR